ncbi:hypothetical protein Hanom_Chr15g01350071 [Helianthus anomalus]
MSPWTMGGVTWFILLHICIVAKLEIFDRRVENVYTKISIKPGVKNVYIQKFLYENYILFTTERKVRGSAALSRPTKLRPCICKFVLS